MAPPPTSVEKLFEQFRSSHTPDALGQVFDLVADDLFAVALHLAGDRAAAEDLVQTTFLLAIQRAGSWDARRPLRPWLFGLLDKQVRRLWRQRKRLTKPVPPREAPVGPPLQTVLDAETSRLVHDAIASLPEPYRRVVDLSLREQLSPVAIATRLGCAAGSVRTQLWRGLERLRAALPPGLALAGLLSATPALAAVRSQVMRAAASAPAVAGAWFGLSPWLAKAAVIAGAATAVAGAVLFSESGRQSLPPATVTNAATRVPELPVAAPSAATPDRIASPAVAPPAGAAVADAAPEIDLRTLSTQLLYEELRRLFAADPVAAAATAQALLHEWVNDNRCEQERLGAVLAAWLDAGGAVDDVLAAALSAVPDTLPANVAPGLVPFELALAWAAFPPGGGPSAGRRAELAAALQRVADSVRDHAHRGASVAMALQALHATDGVAQATLIRLAGSRERRVRGSAWTALAQVLAPESLLPIVDLAPTPIRNEDDCLEDVQRAMVLVQAGARTGDRGVWRSWLLQRLRWAEVAGEGASGVSSWSRTWLDGLLEQMSADDLQALRADLQQLAAGQGAVARALAARL